MAKSVGQMLKLSEILDTEGLEDSIRKSTGNSNYLWSQRRKILPSAECMKIAFKNHELDFVQMCRLVQEEEDERHFLNSSPSLSSIGYLEADCKKSGVNSAKRNLLDEMDSGIYSDYNSTGAEEMKIPVKRRIIHPEPELSNPHHIPAHIIEYEEKLEADVRKQQKLTEMSGRGRPSVVTGNYWRARNTVGVSMRVFGPNRPESLFKFMFGKFRDQHRIK